MSLAECCILNPSRAWERSLESTLKPLFMDAIIIIIKLINLIVLKSFSRNSDYLWHPVACLVICPSFCGFLVSHATALLFKCISGKNCFPLASLLGGFEKFSSFFLTGWRHGALFCCQLGRVQGCVPRDLEARVNNGWQLWKQLEAKVVFMKISGKQQNWYLDTRV